jgi:hypothetical protein
MLNSPYISTFRIQNVELSLYCHLEYPGNEAGEESPLTKNVIVITTFRAPHLRYGIKKVAP